MKRDEQHEADEAKKKVAEAEKVRQHELELEGAMEEDRKYDLEVIQSQKLG